jgi:diguanylate cyclase (GGDEF)-like protein/PAS domain S-box-containing protein
MRMGGIVPGELWSAVADLAAAAAAGARLVGRLSGWPCGFVALGDDVQVGLLRQHGDLTLDEAALWTVASTVAALGRRVFCGTPLATSDLVDPLNICSLPLGCTAMVAVPLIADGGETIGVIGAIDDGSGAIDPATLDAIADVAALLAANVTSKRRLMRRDAEAVAAAAAAAAAGRREARLRAALDSLPHFIWMTDPAGRYVEQNAWDRDAFGDLTGRTALGASLSSELRSQWRGVHRRVLAGEVVRSASWRRHPGSDGERWVESVMAPLIINGAVEGLVGLTVDRTEQAVTERRLRASEARFRAAVDALPCSLFICDLDGRHLAQNRVDRDLWGDCIGKTFAEIGLPPELSDYIPAAIERVRRGETVHKPLAYESEGRRHYEDEIYAPIYTDGTVTGFVGLTIDQTAQVEQERQLRESEAQLADYVDTASDWVWETDAEHRITSLAGWPANALLPPDRLIGRRRWDIAGGDPARDVLWREHLDDLEARRRFRGFTYAYSSVDDGEIWSEVSGNPVFDAAGTFLGYRGTARDVTPRKRAEAALREAHAKLDAMAQSGLIGMTAGQGFLIEEANDSFLQRLGLDRCALERGLDWRQLLAPELVAEEEAAANRLAFTGAVYTKEVVYRRPDGGHVPVLLNSVVLDGARQRWFALVQDLTPIKLAEARVRTLAERDGLTGLANRRVLLERLEGELAERRRPGACAALLLLDLDSFKAVNDSLGHDAGDRLLQIIGARLSAVVRDTDTIARLGGDEFAIILRGLQGSVAVTEVAEKILAALREPLVLDARLVRPNGSIGITLFSGDCSTPAALLKQADLALYKAKAHGSGAMCFFEPALLEARERRRRLSDAVGRAVGTEAFGIVLQPRVALEDGRHVATEALARWRLDEIERPAALFIGLAEENGSILALGRHLRRLAFQAVRRLDAAGLDAGLLALNVAASELKQGHFADSLAADLATHGLPPERIEIEVAEHVLLDREGDKVTVGLLDLRRLGVGITLDNFGASYASLTHLRRFPLDRLKIDRSIVQGIGVDGDEAVMVRGIIGLAHTLGMTVVAEGVETAEQLSFLRLHGCDLAQGHHLAEPLSPAALEAWLGHRMRPHVPAATVNAIRAGNGVDQ